MLGVAAPATDAIGLFPKPPYTVVHLNPEISIIGVVGLLILISLTFVKTGIIKKVPPPIIVVLSGCIIGIVIHLTEAHTPLSLPTFF
jgi:uncharacterized membrane protein SpoIIM required for sporulation